MWKRRWRCVIPLAGTMKEEEGAMVYMSPLVKQDLAKLEKDGESRRVALHALKQCVENLEPSSVPRFLAQVSESKDTGGSRSYAISLYEEVARVHGKLIIPQIGRVMTTMTRSLSGSGSSPQLHQACAKVAAAVVRYSIDSDSSAAEAEEILKDVSRPLIGLLTGKMEHVAAGSATCMQALVESEKWKNAPPDLVSEVCHRTTTALGDKSTRTVAHMQLARSLATVNPGTLNVYGACLIHAAEEVLSSSVYSWQHRRCAAQMVQAVLGIVDRETLALEFHAITQVLENCKHDRMPHVRTAVCEALQAARLVMTGETINEEDDGDHLGSISFDDTIESPQRRNWNSSMYSPSSQDTYNLSSYTPPPEACDSASSDPFSTPQNGSTGRMKRSLLFPSKTDGYSVSSVTVPTSVLINGHDTISVMGNVRPLVNGGSIPDSRGRLSGHNDSAPAFHKKFGDQDIAVVQRSEEHLVDERDFTPTVMQDHPKGKVESRFSPLEAQITRSFGEAEGDLLAEDEEILSRGAAELGYGPNGANTRSQWRLPNAIGHFRQDSQTPESMGDSHCVQSVSISLRGGDSGRSDASDSVLPGKMGDYGNNVTEKVVDVLENKQIYDVSLLQGLPGGKPNVLPLNAGISHAEYMKLASLSNNPEDGFSALKPRVLITTADFLPYTTPRRLVLSLQSQLSSPGDEVGNEEQVRRSSGGAGMRTEFNEDAVRRVVDGTGKRIDFNEDADMDVESSSDSGWSVRDNPIASDDSATEECSKEEMKEKHTELRETFTRPRKVQRAGVAPGKKTISPQVKLLDRGNKSDRSESSVNDELGGSTVEDATPCYQSPKPLRTPDAVVTCLSCTESQRRRSAMKAQEWDLGLDVNRAAADQGIGARRSMLFDQSRTSSDISHGSKAYTNDSIDDTVWSDEDEPGWCTSLVRSVKDSCSRISSVTETVLRGSLCVVIAVPLTMLLARVWLSPQDSFLMPT